MTESAGGISSIFHKKVADAQDKMFKKLDPEDREFMEEVSSKVDMLELMSVIQEDPTKLMTIFEQAGLSNEDANRFMRVGMKLTKEMQSQ